MKGTVEEMGAELRKHSAPGQRSRGFQGGSDQEGLLKPRGPGCVEPAGIPLCCFCLLNFTQILEIINPMLWDESYSFFFSSCFHMVIDYYMIIKEHLEEKVESKILNT